MNGRRFYRLVNSMTILAMLCTGTASYGAGAKGAPLALPFTESFTSSKLDPAWTSHLANGNTMEVKDGSLVIAAKVDTTAHIERPLGVDLIRVSCAIRPVSGEADTSLVLRWDQRNFCQIGVSTPDTHRLRIREVLGTYVYEYDIGPWPAGQWRMVAIEVGKDCVRYLAADDGPELTAVRVSRRPERYRAAPTVLIVGEGTDGRTFPRPDPFIDPPASTAGGTSWIRDIQVTKLDEKRCQASAEEAAQQQADERDSLGEQEMAAPDDPTFESVSRHFPAMKWPREAVGVKDHPYAVGVAHDGALQFTEDSARYKNPAAFFEIGEPPYRFGTGPTPCRRRLLNGYMPVVTLTDRLDGLELEQTVFGYTKDFSPDEPLAVCVRLKVTNTGDASGNVALRFRIQPASDKPPTPTWRFDLPAHGSRVIDLKAPYAILESPVTEMPAGVFDAKLAEVAAYWDRLLVPGTRFEIPEKRVHDAYRAWLAYNFLNVHKRGTVYHVCDGSGFYTRVYGYSAALYCNGMDMLGYHDLAERYLDSLLTFMQPNGLLAVNFGDTDTGAALYVMSEHYRITRNADWLRRVAPKMIAMCNWIIEQRREALARSATQPVVTRGLIRYRPYADHLTPAADCFSNGYLCKGLASTAAVFAEIGMSDQAARIGEAADEYRKDITASMDAAVFTDGGMNVLPAIPDTRELWQESNGRANGYYGLVASCILEAGIPPWNDPKADLVVDTLRRRGGLTLGVSRFHDMIDHAYAYGYWMTCLQRDEVKPVILGLYASMAHGMTRDTYAAVECTRIRSGENYWTLPHTYSNTQQLRLLRNMLIREDGDDLLIGQAIPRTWLADGKRIAVTKAPTLFGPTSFATESGKDAARVHVDPPTRNTPHTIKVRLRHPSRQDILTVDSVPKVDLTFKADVIELLNLAGPVDLQVRW